MQTNEVVQSYTNAVLDAAGASAASVFVPTWVGRSDEALLVHTGPEPAAAELATVEDALSFARANSVSSLDPTWADPAAGVPGREPGTILLPIPLVTSLWSPPNRTVPDGPSPARRAADRQPPSVAGWIALRFTDASLDGEDVAAFVFRRSAVLAGRLASLFVRLYGYLTDPLTGLPGRAEFRTVLRDELARARADKTPCSLVLFNPDDFAAINVSHGRKVGDRVLAEIVVRARGALRQSDMVCRYGGAIFAVALRNAGTEAAAIVADKLRDALSASSYAGGGLSLRFSVGAASVAADDLSVRDPVDFVGRAEAALALAKQQGGGCTYLWRDSGAEAPEPLDRLRCAFTGDQDRDYRNMGLLWDTVGLLASVGGTPADVPSRLLMQLRQTLSTSTIALFDVDGQGLALRLGLGPHEGGTTPVPASAITPALHRIAKQAADARAAVWFDEVGERTPEDVPGPIACALPLLVGDALVGVLLLAGVSDHVKFDESDLPFLRGVGGPIALAIERACAAERAREEEANEKRRLVGELNVLRTALRQARLVHVSTQMDDLILTAHRVADTDATVLITGESGTGKELLAHTVHQMSRRRAKPLVIVDCGAIPSTLMESELFGHERGAFTGAMTRSAGRLLQADGGTVLLDEIGELPLDVQSKLLRFVQDRQFTTVGSSVTRSVDVRVLAATNRDLAHEVASGRFRADLYHRLNVIPLTIPPLRERPDDVLEIARHFLGVFAAKYQKPVRTLGAEVERALTAYSWPGNVRELQNRIMRAVIMSTGSALSVEALALPIDAAGPETRTPPSYAVVAAPSPPRAVDATAPPPSLPPPTAPGGLGGGSPWEGMQNALDQMVARAAVGDRRRQPPLGRWLADDLVIAAFATSGQVARRGAALLGVPETTFVRRLRRAQAEADLVRRPPEWALVTRAVERLVVEASPDTVDLLDAAERCLLERIDEHVSDPQMGAALLGTSLPTFRRRMAGLPDGSEEACGNVA